MVILCLFDELPLNRVFSENGSMEIGSQTLQNVILKNKTALIFHLAMILLTITIISVSKSHS